MSQSRVSCFAKYLCYRFLLATVLCCILLYPSLIWILDGWSPKQIQSGKHLLAVNGSNRNPKGYIDHNDWEIEYQNRVRRIREVCKANKNYGMKSPWRIASNRHSGNITYCGTDVCPIISNGPNQLFCFIPKVASTHIKRFFLNISNSDSTTNDSNAVHILANDALRRVSTAYYNPKHLNSFYKIMFVRHPFDRLVSAFRSKAEQPRDKMEYFYSKFWDPIMQALKPESLSKITFKDFVWYLIHTPSREYDIHWVPFFSRCDSCFVEYDFIGKLETARHDFPYAFWKAGIDFNPIWWSNYPSKNSDVTMQYFASIPEDMIRKLYEIYKPDFELFGYSVDQFLSRHVIAR